MVKHVQLTVNNLGERLLRRVNRQVSARRHLVLGVQPSQRLDLAVARLRVHTLSVPLLAGRHWCCDVHQEEVARTAAVRDRAPRRCAPSRGRRNRRGDHCRTRTRELGGNPGDAREVIRDALGMDERDGAATLLVEYNLKRARNSVLARFGKAGEHDHEALLRTRWVRLTEGPHNASADVEEELDRDY